MIFRNQIRQLKQGKNRLFLGISHMPLYLIIIVPFLLNIFATVTLVEHFSTRHSRKTIDNIVNLSSDNINDRLSAYLYNHVEPAEAFEEKTQLLNDYVQRTELDFAAKVIIINNNGSVIATNYIQQGTLSSSIPQKILRVLRGQLGNFTDINREQQFSFAIKQQPMVGQITPWQDEKLGLDWLMIVIIPESELSLLQPSHNLKWQYLAYLLPTTILGIITYIWITLSVKHLSKTASEIARGQYSSRLKGSSIRELKILGRSLRQIAHQLQTVESKTTKDYDQQSLLADMSHELRSPLNAILGFVQIMEQESSMTRSQRENLAIINRSGKRLLSLINDLVDLSKIASNSLTLEQNSFDFTLWLDNMEQSVKFQARNQSLDFSLLREPNLPQYICLDERRLRQVLTNLIDYSLRNTQAGAVIVKVSCYELTPDSVPTEPTTTQQPITPPEELAADDRLRLLNIYFELENPDFSINPEELATLFNATARVRQKQKSPEVSSLSMPISRQLAQLMGGDITVTKNNLPQGTTLRLNIQAQANITPELQIQSTSRRIIGLESDGSEYRILIVDDSKTNRKIMVQLLEPVGFKVQEAVNGKEAVDIWLRWHPHMIWMDIRMPVMNGYEATEQIKSYPQTTSPPIVALTAGTLEEERSLFQAAGCDDFVGKPFSDSIIFDKIAQHLGVRYVYEPMTPLTVSSFRLTADALKIMSDDWLVRVEEAATTLDGDLLTQLLQEIPSNHGELREALQKQVNNFDFDKILSLARQGKGK